METFHQDNIVKFRHFDREAFLIMFVRGPFRIDVVLCNQQKLFLTAKPIATSINARSHVLQCMVALSIDDHFRQCITPPMFDPTIKPPTPTKTREIIEDLQDPFIPLPFLLIPPLTSPTNSNNDVPSEVLLYDFEAKEAEDVSLQFLITGLRKSQESLKSDQLSVSPEIVPNMKKQTKTCQIIEQIPSPNPSKYVENTNRLRFEAKDSKDSSLQFSRRRFRKTRKNLDKQVSFSFGSTISRPIRTERKVVKDQLGSRHSALSMPSFPSKEKVEYQSTCGVLFKSKETDFSFEQFLTSLRNSRNQNKMNVFDPSIRRRRQTRRHVVKEHTKEPSVALRMPLFSSPNSPSLDSENICRGHFCDFKANEQEYSSHQFLTTKAPNNPKPIQFKDSPMFDPTIRRPSSTKIRVIKEPVQYSSSPRSSLNDDYNPNERILKNKSLKNANQLNAPIIVLNPIVKQSRSTDTAVAKEPIGRQTQILKKNKSTQTDNNKIESNDRNVRRRRFTKRQAKRRNQHTRNTSSVLSVLPQNTPRTHVKNVPFGITVCDFQATQPAQLSFEVNDIIILKSKLDDELYFGKRGLKEGIISATCIEILEPLPEDRITVSEFPDEMIDSALKPEYSTKIDSMGNPRTNRMPNH